ncbi:uncharacterized protein DNG_10045 [Cephalotrichum gorgonifer]|uniref:Uncharacterized protein n=1 Tax=Cephalotrichum gorgonifer TaxID=2041049 RepID=A0AAE8SZU7_9PEZI|nr:uncharacterized protein DNG_10045 [Cephalotrichum gorgonifer]
MSSGNDVADFQIGWAVLNGLTLVVTSGLFCASLCLCRRSGDQARSVTRWMKLSFLFFSLYTFLAIIYAIFFILYWKDIIYATGPSRVLGPLASTAETMLKTLVLATLSSLARGILFARQGQRAKLALPAAVATYGITAINFVLAIAYLGVALWYNFGEDSYYSNTGLHLNRLSAVPDIFIFVGSVVLLGTSGLVFTKVKGIPTLKTAGIVFIVAAFFFFVSALYEIIYIGLYIPLSPSSDFKSDYPFSTILMYFFGILPILLSLAAVFHLTRTKGKGLYTITGPPGGAFNPAQVPGQGVPFQGQPMQQGAYQPAYYPPQGAPGAPPPGWQPQAYYPPQQQQQFVPVPQQQFVPAQQQQWQQGQQVPQQQQPQYTSTPSPVTQTPPHEAPTQPPAQAAEVKG